MRTVIKAPHVGNSRLRIMTCKGRKKLVLINPVNLNRSGFSASHSSRFPPLNLGVVAALTPGDWDVEVIDENFDEFSFRDADLMGIPVQVVIGERSLAKNKLEIKTRRDKKAEFLTEKDVIKTIQSLLKD